MMHRRLPSGSLACALALAVAAHAAEPVRLDIKPGLWEMTSTAKTAATPALPPALLQTLPPQQRDKILAGVQSLLSKPVTHKSCVTPGTLAQRFTEHDTHPGCDQRLLTNTSGELALTGSCANGLGTDTYKADFQRHDRETVTGNLSLSVTNGAKTVSLERAVSARWLGASCGGVK